MRKRDTPVRSEEQPQQEQKAMSSSNEGMEAPLRLPSGEIITEEYVQAALAKYPEVHPGWKYFFTRTRELANDLRRKQP